MKPKPIMARQDTLESKKMSIETPMGTLESDSGNHYLDVAIHTSDEEHRITKYKGERVTILAFVRSLK